MRYEWYITSPAWFGRRDRYYEEHGRSCEGCGREANRMNLHYLSYKHLGSEPDEDLIALCVACHRETHGLTVLPKRKHRGLASYDRERNRSRGFGNI